LKRYPRACGSYQDCIYLSVDMITQSVWFISGFYISLSLYDIPELVVPIRILYISQLKRYPRACVSYQEFIYLSVDTISQSWWFLSRFPWYRVAARKEATEPCDALHFFECFTVATMTWLTDMEYMCHKWPWIYSTCRKHFPFLS
jgi:hypothetical protein